MGPKGFLIIRRRVGLVAFLCSSLDFVFPLGEFFLLYFPGMIIILKWLKLLYKFLMFGSDFNGFGTLICGSNSEEMFLLLCV